MKKMILGLIWVVVGQASAEESFPWSRMVTSGSQIAAAYALPNYGVGPDVKFGMYFAAGLEYPFTTALALVPVGIWGQDPVALSVAFSLANRGMAITGLNQTVGMDKGQAFMWVTAADLFLGKIPGLEKFAQTKYMGAIGNMLENTFGMLPAGLAMLAIPVSNNFGDTASSEFSEESGMRVTPAIFANMLPDKSTDAVVTATNGAMAASLFYSSFKLKQINPKLSSWMGAAGMSLMMNVLVLASMRVHEQMGG